MDLEELELELFSGELGQGLWVLMFGKAGCTTLAVLTIVFLALAAIIGPPLPFLLWQM